MLRLRIGLGLKPGPRPRITLHSSPQTPQPRPPHHPQPILRLSHFQLCALAAAHVWLQEAAPAHLTGKPCISACARRAGDIRSRKDGCHSPRGCREKLVGVHPAPVHLWGSAQAQDPWLGLGLRLRLMLRLKTGLGLELGPRPGLPPNLSPHPPQHRPPYHPQQPILRPRSGSAGAGWVGAPNAPPSARFWGPCASPSQP